MPKVEINFSNRKAAEHFMSWLSGKGEQDYWNWMEYREEEEPGPITATSFDYDQRKLVIKTECGRLDDE